MTDSRLALYFTHLAFVIALAPIFAVMLCL